MKLASSGVAGRRKSCSGWTVFVHPAFVHEHQRVTDLAGKAHFMRHHDQRHAFRRQLAHHGQHFVDQLRVQRRGDLVAQQHLGRHRQRTGNRHPLLLATGQLLGVGVKLVRQPDFVQHLRRQRTGVAAGGFLHHLAGQHHVFAHAQVRKQVELLEHHAHFQAQGAQVGLPGMQALAVYLHYPLVNAFQAVDGAQQGALAGAAAADDGHHLALADLQVDALEHVVGAEMLVKRINANERHAVSFPVFWLAATAGNTGRNSPAPPDRTPETAGRWHWPARCRSW